MGIERQKELKETKKGLPLSQAFPLCELRVDAAAQAMLIRCDGRKERKRKDIQEWETDAQRVIP